VTPAPLVTRGAIECAPAPAQEGGETLTDALLANDLLSEMAIELRADAVPPSL
jgi:hypothetical protein